MKLLMENWRRFINEDSSIEELDTRVQQFVDLAQDPKAAATDYIPLLQKIAAHPEFQTIAAAGQTDAAGPPDEQFTVTPGQLPASELHATQAEIGLDQSLLDQLATPEWAIKKGRNPTKNALGFVGEPIEMLCKDARCAILTFGPINGKYRILDGHHRWSQIMMMNPAAQVAVDNIEPKGPLNSVENALKLMQLAIALKADNIKLLDFEGDNMMRATAEGIKQYVRDHITEGSLKLLGQFLKTPDLTVEQAAEYISGNLAGLQNNKGFNHLTRGGVMPQAADSGTSQAAVNQALASGEVNFDAPSPEDVDRKAGNKEKI